MKRAGLVLEGGANRGVFTSGALDYLMEQDFYIPYAVDPVIGNIIIFVIITDQIIFSLLCHHLIRRNDIFPDTAIRSSLRVELLICQILHILKRNLALFMDGIIQHFNIQKKLFIICLTLR